jgi:hypothetical protein
MSTKSHVHTRCGTLRKSSISTRGYAEIHIQRPFFDNKNSIWKILGLKIKTTETCSSASSIHRNFYLWKTLKSRFLVEFQSFVFGPIWADFGSFGQFRVEFAALTVAESLPEVWLKSLNPIILKSGIQVLHGTSHWKATIHTYSLKKFPKVQQL